MKTVTLTTGQLARAWGYTGGGVGYWVRHGLPIEGVCRIRRSPGGQYRFDVDIAWLETNAPEFLRSLTAKLEARKAS